MKNRKKSFLAGAGILAVSVIFAKVLGAFYRIPLTNILGAEGMGIYQFVYPVFALLLTLSSGAIPSAISITIAKRVANNDEAGAKSDFTMALLVCLFTGLIGTAVLVGIAYPLTLLQSKEAFVGYLTVAPAVLVVTVISAFRGWFMGHKDMVPSSISQITEGIVKLGVGIVLTKLLIPYGIRYAVAGALFGVLFSEIVTLCILFFIYLKRDKGFAKVKLREKKGELKEFYRLVLPLVLCGMILPLSQFVDSVLLVNLLKLNGQDTVAATANYGVFTGTVSPLINLPVMVCITLGIAITPQMVEGREKHDIDHIMDKCSTATKFTLMMGVPFVFLFIFLAEGIVGVLYPSLGAERLALAALLLKISAISVLGLSLFQIYSSMLQGLGRPKVPVVIMSVSVITKLLLSAVLVPIFGIIGGAIAAAAGYCLAGVGIMIYFFGFVRKADGLLKNASLITLCGVIMSLVILIGSIFGQEMLTVISIAAGSLTVYFIGLFALKVFSRDELGSLPLGSLWLKIDGLFHKNRG